MKKLLLILVLATSAFAQSKIVHGSFSVDCSGVKRGGKITEDPATKKLVCSDDNQNYVSISEYGAVKGVTWATGAVSGTAVTLTSGTVSSTSVGNVVAIEGAGSPTDLSAYLVSLSSATTAVMSSPSYISGSASTKINSKAAAGATATATITCTVTAGSTTVVCPASTFNVGNDVKTAIEITGAGKPKPFISTITAVTDSTHFTIASASTLNVSSVAVTFGVDSGPAIIAAANANRNKAIDLGDGDYLIDNSDRAGPLTVNGFSTNGNGTCRVQTAAAHGLTGTLPVQVTNVNGTDWYTVPVNGSFIGTVVDSTHIDLAESTCSGLSYVSPGVLYVTSEIVLQSFSGRIIGHGPNTHLVGVDGTSAVIKLINSRGTILEKFNFTTATPSTSFKNPTSIFQGIRTSTVRIEDVMVERSNGPGIVFSRSDDPVVINANVQNTTSDGLSFYSVNRPKVINPYVRNTYDDCIGVVTYSSEPSPYNASSGGFIEGADLGNCGAHGLSVAGHSNIQIHGLQVDGASNSGFDVIQDSAFGTPSPTDVSFDTVVVRNVPGGTGTFAWKSGNGYGFEGNNVQKVRMKDVVIYGSQNYNCISGLFGSSADMTLNNVKCIGGQNGIYAKAGLVWSISNFVSSGTSQRGLRIENTTDTHLNNIRIENCYTGTSGANDAILFGQNGSNLAQRVFAKGITVVDTATTPTCQVITENAGSNARVFVTGVEGDIVNNSHAKPTLTKTNSSNTMLYADAAASGGVGSSSSGQFLINSSGSVAGATGVSVDGSGNVSASSLKSTGDGSTPGFISLCQPDGTVCWKLGVGSVLSLNRTLNIPDASPTVGQALVVSTAASPVFTYSWSTVTTPSSTESPTNKSFDSEATGNTLTHKNPVFFAVAGANGSTCFSALDLPASNAPTANPYGTSYNFCALDFDDASNKTATFRTRLPADWASAKAIDFTLGYFVNSATSQAVKWTVATACLGDNASYGNPTFNTAQTLSGTSASRAAFRSTLTTTVTTTGCAAGSTFVVRVGRDVTDTSTATLSLAEIGVAPRSTK